MPVLLEENEKNIPEGGETILEDERDVSDSGNETDDAEAYMKNQTGDLDALQLYLSQIRDIPLMTREEELECARKAQEGDREARNRIIQGNLRFVLSKAIRYSNKGVDMVDLIQEGNLGLIRAVEKFDYRMGTRFTTYAGYWVRQYLELAVSDTGRTVSVPRKTISKFRSGVRKAVRNNPGLEDYPTAGMIAEEMKTTPRNVEFIFRAVQEPCQLDAPITDGEDTTLSEIIEDGRPAEYMEELLREDRKNALNLCLSKLTLRERVILQLLAGTADGIVHTTEEIGEEYHVTRERIRQIADGARNRIAQEVPARAVWDFTETIQPDSGDPI